jgi:hypothetical protein
MNNQTSRRVPALASSEGMPIQTIETQYTVFLDQHGSAYQCDKLEDATAFIDEQARGFYMVIFCAFVDGQMEHTFLFKKNSAHILH